MPVTINRKDLSFFPDPARVICRLHLPGGETRSLQIIHKIMELSDDDVNITLNNVLRDFSKRHRNISKIFDHNFSQVMNILNEIERKAAKSYFTEKDQKILKKLKNLKDPESTEQRMRKYLIGSFFTMEYSIESAAFFNPSIVEDPNQTGLPEKGQKRVIISFRATGEGHISSIVFREGIIDKNNNITFKSTSRLVDVPEVIKRHVYKKKVFLKQLDEMNLYGDAEGKNREDTLALINNTIAKIMNRLDNTFVYGKLQASIEETLKDNGLTIHEKKVIDAIKWLANSHYEIEFSLDTAISERVIFPISYSERNGIEDARFVKFINDNGSSIYYGTYTAYDGYTILPKLIRTKDFIHFKVMPLNGLYAQNKGMALFPRKINGKYVMFSRYDGVNNYIMYSDNINLWQNAYKIKSPIQPWGYIQTGNCGSPIETEKGWLMLTHGVGPMRKYCIGAVLLDLEDPTKVLGYLKDPLLVPNEEEREGYVPNVVYSCGSLVHNNELILPYGISDTASKIVTVPLNELLEELMDPNH
jgi:predicted GH43/DUF377 family glycosyl hydrolase